MEKIIPLMLIWIIVSGCASMASYEKSYLAKREHHIEYYCMNTHGQALAYLKGLNSGHPQSKGESMLGDFGSRFMPLSYRKYEKCREALQVASQEYQETINEASKNLEVLDQAHVALVAGASKCVRQRNELIHYYLLHKVGGIDLNELLNVDQTPTLYRPLSGNCLDCEFPVALSAYRELSSDEQAFVAKFMPETWRYFKNVRAQRLEGCRLFNEVEIAMKELNVSAYDMSMVACKEYHYITSKELIDATKRIAAVYLKHKLATIDIKQVAKIDEELSSQLREFAKAGETYISKRARGPMFAPDCEMAKFYPELFCNVMRWQIEALGGACTKRPSNASKARDHAGDGMFLSDFEFVFQNQPVTGIIQPNGFYEGVEVGYAANRITPGMGSVIVSIDGHEETLTAKKLSDGMIVPWVHEPANQKIIVGKIAGAKYRSMMRSAYKDSIDYDMDRIGTLYPSLLSCLAMDVDGRCYDFTFEEKNGRCWIGVELK